jgi:enamine deaminase RidA (YjgF/YER057c/UK114 family)
MNARTLPPVPPHAGRTAILIKGLLKPEWRFEIEAIAVLPA